MPFSFLDTGNRVTPRQVIPFPFPSTSGNYMKYYVFHGIQITDEILDRCALLFSSNYGICPFWCVLCASNSSLIASLTIRFSNHQASQSPANQSNWVERSFVLNSSMTPIAPCWLSVCSMKLALLAMPLLWLGIIVVVGFCTHYGVTYIDGSRRSCWLGDSVSCQLWFFFFLLIWKTIYYCLFRISWRAPEYSEKKPTQIETVITRRNLSQII